MTKSAADLLPAIREIADAASRAILEVYNGAPSAVDRKGDGSPVTAADLAAEAVIVPALKKLAPDIAIISEESFTEGARPPADGGRFWLVDPLDGTKEFIKRNGEFTVNIALIENGQPVLGVVQVPVTGDVYAAAGVGTAIWAAPGRAERAIRVRQAPKEGVTIVSSRSHADNEALDRYLATMEVAERKVSGSSVKFCLVARGEADLYPRLGPTMEWDTAAAHAVVLGAGGRVDTEDGKPLSYGKAGFKNPFFFVFGQRV
jgi:3'(2'), 5'-bisphosphate nucleotidase